jgi:hypothetical protein
MPNYGPAPDDRRGDANERQAGIDVEVVSPAMTCATSIVFSTICKSTIGRRARRRPPTCIKRKPR